MTFHLKGIIPPIVTPLVNNSELDLIGLEKLINHIINGGVHGIFLLGTTGEAPSLSIKLRKEFIRKACSVIDNRVPVLVGITDTCVNSSLEIAEAAKNAGADALVIAPPYYYPITQNEFIEYLEFLTPKLPLPFLLYNMPSCTKLHLSINTIKKGKELGAVGIKDSSGDISYLQSIIEIFKNSPEFCFFTGTELFLPEIISSGGHGLVAGGANIFPKIYVELYEASIAKDLVKIEELRQKLVLIENLIYNVGENSSKYIRSIKCALSVLGICSDYVASPFSSFKAPERDRIIENLKYFDQ